MEVKFCSDWLKCESDGSDGDTLWYFPVAGEKLWSLSCRMISGGRLFVTDPYL